MARPSNLKFRYEDFLFHDIYDLMINIWSYSDFHGVGCTKCTQYKKWCIDALKKMGTSLHRRECCHSKT